MLNPAVCDAAAARPVTGKPASDGPETTSDVELLGLWFTLPLGGRPVSGRALALGSPGV